jgi:hypothetical protein
MSDVHDSGPPSIAEAMYGKDGPINGRVSDDGTRLGIEAGIARPAAERALFGNGQQPPPAGQTPAAAFNPERYAAPEGGHLDPAMMGEFSTAARELGINQQGGEKLLDLHHKAMTQGHERARADWYATTERDFGGQLPRVVSDIQAAVGNDADAQRFYKMLEWSGLAVEPSVLRVLHKLARRY